MPFRRFRIGQRPSLPHHIGRIRNFPQSPRAWGSLAAQRCGVGACYNTSLRGTFSPLQLILFHSIYRFNHGEHIGKANWRVPPVPAGHQPGALSDDVPAGCARVRACIQDRTPAAMATCAVYALARVVARAIQRRDDRWFVQAETPAIFISNINQEMSARVYSHYKKKTSQSSRLSTQQKQ